MSSTQWLKDSFLRWLSSETNLSLLKNYYSADPWWAWHVATTACRLPYCSNRCWGRFYSILFSAARLKPKETCKTIYQQKCPCHPPCKRVVVEWQFVQPAVLQLFLHRSLACNDWPYLSYLSNICLLTYADLLLMSVVFIFKNSQCSRRPNIMA